MIDKIIETLVGIMLIEMLLLLMMGMTIGIIALLSVGWDAIHKR